MNLVEHVARIVTKILSQALFEYLKQWDQLWDKDVNGNTIVHEDLQCAKIIKINLLNTVSVKKSVWTKSWKACFMASGSSLFS